MRLCFLAGANSIHFYRWIKYFADRGHEVHWISLTPNIFGDIKNARLYLMKGFPARPVNILLNAIAVRRLVRKINPDIFHTHYVGVNGVVGALSGFHPFVTTAWGSDVLIAPKSKIAKPLIKFVLEKSDLITTDGKNTIRAMIDLGVNPRKIKLIRSGVDIKKYKPEKREDFRRELFGTDSKIIISLRNFDPVYNLESLIKAIPLILNKVPEARFIIAGKGPQEKYLKDLAESLEALGAIKFVGFIPNPQLPQYLNSADVYVSTSLSDSGLAASTAEAMACELPVVITDSGDNKEWVKDDENGFVVPVKSPKILAEKIVCLLKDENKRKSFGKISRKIIEEKNNYYLEMAKVEEIYKQLIKNNE